jgi:hypothetical protein
LGSLLPLGYEQRNGELVVVEEEAERVRLIFRRYLEVSGINELARDLRARNICTTARTFSTGKICGGIPFGRGALSYLLRNRFAARSPCLRQRRSWHRFAPTTVTFRNENFAAGDRRAESASETAVVPGDGKALAKNNEKWP